MAAARKRFAVNGVPDILSLPALTLLPL